METTLTGYEIGRLKGEEAALLEKRSLLKMELARLTTKKRLSEASGEETDASKNSSVVAK
jgi:regulator of replication initiation timing